MQPYDFNQIIERRGTNATKTDLLQAMFGASDLIPMWIADMDFATPSFIAEAVRARLEHPILGYTRQPDTYVPAIVSWLAARHGWQVQPEWLCHIPGIVKGIGFAINLFTSEGDKVIIQPPAYHPFRSIPRGNKREVVYNPLRLADDTYEMDFEQLERVAADTRAKMLILANPHNPGGIAWDSQTLAQLADICARHRVLVVADEIHADLPLFGHRHTPFATVSDKAAQNSITFGAPSKTFNMAGFASSYAVVPSETIRQKFFSWLDANEFNVPNIFAAIAAEAAYAHGAAWLEQLLAYVEDNVKFVEDFCAARIPSIRPMRPQASFLVWLDCRQLRLNHADLQHLFVHQAHLALNDGEMFGPGGEGFMRMNIGTPRSVLQQALEQLEQAVKEYCVFC